MLKLVPDVVNQRVIHALPPEASARDAGVLMADHDISSVVVNTPSGQLAGIVTERDLARRVVAKGLAASDTPLHTIMTADPVTLPPDANAYDAMQLMRQHLVRHVPVVDSGKVVAMVSVRDLRHAIAHEVEPAHEGLGAAVHRWLRRAGI